MVFIIGVIVQIVTTDKWYQIGIGRCVAGVGVGGLSILTPMYQSETAPRQIRGGLVSAYQLFITFGIFLAECINYGTEARPDASSWRITMGIGFIFPVAMAIGILFLRESPRWDYRRGKIREARETLALSYGVSESHYEVVREMREIREKFDEEKRSEHPWFEILTGPRMAYRTIIGMVLQSLQQLTGINFFLYFGTTIFKGVGLSNPFITQMILGKLDQILSNDFDMYFANYNISGGINFGCTFLGLYLVDHYGRRRCLVAGGLWMFVCFMIFASVGHFQFYPNYNAMPKPGTTAEKDVNTAGNVMIVFTALFMFGFATSWGPIVWALVSEIYPSRYRARSMGIATSANWTWNFLISFFTPYCISAIEFRYGYVFAACCFAGAVFVYFCVPESQGRTLEEIDTMYIMHVTPWKSSGWNPPRVRKANVEDNVGRI